ncbi:MAG TPA: hypothetical protein VME66_05715 [Candidatus Acidoferrales bacterium]|nr:hypothetical protein [Candidatus Acidoferrales bacterium]
MNEPFLSLVLCGAKSIESRFSQKRCAPYGQVSDGDLILLKENSGPVVAIAVAGEIRHFQLDELSWETIWSDYRVPICADEQFVTQQIEASYATLIQLRAVLPLADISVEKRDRRGWVVLSERRSQLHLL